MSRASFVSFASARSSADSTDASADAGVQVALDDVGGHNSLFSFELLEHCHARTQENAQVRLLPNGARIGGRGSDVRQRRAAHAFRRMQVVARPC